MNRREFINLLTDSLVGRVPREVVSEKADYYRRYITEQAEKTGDTEEEVIETLGPPEMIAHTIIDVYEAEHGVYEGSSQAASGGFQDGNSEGASDDEGQRGGFFSFHTGGNGCILTLLIVTIVVLAVGIWMVHLIAAYPILVVIVVLALWLWNEYKKRH